MAFLGAPAPAEAHSRLLAAVPATGSTVRQQPAAVRLTFNEQVRLRYSTVVVTGTGGDVVSRGALTQVDSMVSRPLGPVRSGTYAVAWRVVSADGHPISGRFTFRVALPAGAEPVVAARPPAAAAAGGDGLGWLLGAVAAVAAVAAGAAVVGAVVVGRRRRPA